MSWFEYPHNFACANGSVAGGFGVDEPLGLAAATEALNGLRQRLAGAKTRLRGATDIDLQIKSLRTPHY